MSDYLYKIDTFIKKNLHNIEKPQIVEFGVKEGRSTKLFLDICDKFNGKLTSIALMGGFAEVESNDVTVLVNAAELSENIDSPSAEKEFGI